MDVYFAEMDACVILTRRTDTQYPVVFPDVRSIREESLYVPGEGVFSAPHSILDSPWLNFSTDPCLFNFFEYTIAGNPTSLRNLRKFDMPEASVKALLEIGKRIQEDREGVRKALSPLSLTKIVREYF